MYKKVNEVVMRLCFLEKEPAEDSRLKEDLGIDSLKLVELIVQLEEACKVEFDESSLNPDSILTVKDLYALVSKAVKESGHAV